MFLKTQGIGRPTKGHNWADAIRQELAKQDGKNPWDIKTAIVRQAIKFARNGHEWAVAWLADRTDGKPTQMLSMEVRPSPFAHLSDEEIAAALDIIKQRKAAIPAQEITTTPTAPQLEQEKKETTPETAKTEKTL